MRTYEHLTGIAENLSERWSNAGLPAVSHAELTMLVAACRQVDPRDLEQVPTVAHIISKADVALHIGNELHSEACLGWPQAIIDELERSDKQYAYRPQGEDWEVYGVHLSGEEDWLATVVTETVAAKLVVVMSPPSTSEPKD